jgi:iron complex transport system substrate-binding protein
MGNNMTIHGWLGKTFAVGLFVLLVSSALVLSLFHPRTISSAPQPPFLTDMSGERTHMQAPAQRVVIYPLMLPAYLAVNNGTEHLLAASKGSIGQMSNNLLGSVFPAAKNTQEITGAYLSPRPADLEELMRIGPDAVFSGWGPGIVDPLKTVGMPGVVAISWGRPADYKRDFTEVCRLIGEVTNKRERVHLLISRYDRERHQVLDRLPANAVASANAVVLDGGRSYQILSARGFALNEELLTLGVRNKGLELRTNFGGNIEDLLRLDPDVLLLVPEPGEDSSPARFMARPEYRSLRAVKNRRVYTAPMYSLSNLFLEEPLLLDWLAEIFYPDVTPLQLRAKYKQTFLELFQYQLSDDEIDRAIYVEENLQSQDYERFTRQALLTQNAELSKGGGKNR